MSLAYQHAATALEFASPVDRLVYSGQSRAEQSRAKPRIEMMLVEKGARLKEEVQAHWRSLSSVREREKSDDDLRQTSKSSLCTASPSLTGPFSTIENH